MPKSLAAWLRVGTREALAVHLITGLVLLAIALPAVTLMFWLGGADLTQRGPSLATYILTCVYVIYLVVGIGHKKYQLAVLYKNFR